MSVVSAAIAQAIGETLSAAQTILAIVHISPDGDAVSSLVATGLALKTLNKRVDLVCDDGSPERFRFLPLVERISNAPDPSAEYDLIIALDCGDENRLGRAYTSLSKPRPAIINVDHHITNTRFGKINLIAPEAAATTEILFDLFGRLGLDIDSRLATALLTGMVTDTLNFRTANVTAATLKAAGALVEAGADLYAIGMQALHLHQLSTLLIWRKGLNNMRFEDGLLWTAISNSDRIEVEHKGGSSFGLGNMLADVYDASMSAVLLEMSDGRVNVGFRCRPPYRVSDVAVELGGGGHDLAAGCTLDGPLEAAVAQVVSLSKETIQKQRAERAGQPTARP